MFIKTERWSWITWTVKTTGMVADCPVGLAEDVIAESARAETDGAADVGGANLILSNGMCYASQTMANRRRRI
jgi:hypothetical protein